MKLNNCISILKIIAIFHLIQLILSDNVDIVCVSGTGGEGLRIHENPCTNSTTIKVALEGDRFEVIAGPLQSCSYTWFQLKNSGWHFILEFVDKLLRAVTDYLETCGGSNWNIFGVGLVNPGDSNQFSYVHQVAGDNGWILLIFPGVDNTTSSAPIEWINNLKAAYASNLKPVVRLGPPWGQSYYRDESDDPNHLVYTTLANAFKNVVSGLLEAVPSDQNLYLEIDNEIDLCYEWFCQTPGSPISYTQIASEYAHFFSYVVNALRQIGSDQIKISHAPLAPGGAIQCGCCGQQNCPQDQGGITGLQFMQAMMESVPGIFNEIDFLASHSYGSQGIGWGFNVPYDQAIPGLKYYQLELQTIQRDIQVLITETGWATNSPGLPTCTEQNKADWTVASYSNVWLNDSNVMGVMPFMLMDATWGDKYGYEYVLMSGDIVPVFTEVQQLRCSLGFGPC